MNEPFGKLQETIGYKFSNTKLLEQALTHASYASEMSVANNERLEFLGDSLIEAAVRSFLFLKKPEASEGELTRTKSKIVCKAALARIAKKIALGESLLLGRGEEAQGRDKEAILADALEALIGAIYLDSSYVMSMTVVYDLFADELQNEVGQNFKGDLQEICQKKFRSLPKYKVVQESGTSHQKIFEIEVLVKGKVLGKGDGQNKREAEQRAAKDALNNVLSQGAGDGECLLF